MSSFREEIAIVSQYRHVGRLINMFCCKRSLLALCIVTLLGSTCAQTGSHQYRNPDFERYSDYDEESVYANAGGAQHRPVTTAFPQFTPAPLKPAVYAERRPVHENPMEHPTYTQQPQVPLAEIQPTYYQPIPQPREETEDSARDVHMEILIPRLGYVKGLRGYKQIKNRAINAFLGLKYGKVLPGLGRFQVS